MPNQGKNAPVVSITAPVAGETGLSVPVVVAASDDVGVVSVKLELGGTVVRELTQAPWSATLEVSAGPHTLVAIAADASGKTTRSTAVAFTAKEAPVGGADAGTGGGTGTGTDPVTKLEPDGVRGGCSCDGTSAGPMALGLMLLGALRRRRNSVR